jgi:dihydrolipoamide dehydrogenase
LSTKVVGGSGSATGCKVDIEPAAGGAKQTLECDIILVSTGRRPFT